jgi:hypothetical protein
MAVGTRLNAATPDLVVNRWGDALAAWWSGGCLWTAARRAGRSFTSGRPLPSVVKSPEFDIAMNDRGDAVVAWLDQGGATFVASRPAGGRFGRPEALPVQLGFPGVAIDRGGTVAVGVVTHGLTRESFLAFRPPGGRFGPLEPVEELDTLAYDGGGRLTLTRLLFDPSSCSGL